MAAKFATALQLNKRESHYFEALVFHNQADNEADRDRYFSQILSLRPATKIEGVTPEQLEYASNPLYVTLREMTAMPEFVEDAAWINDHLTQRVKPAEIRRALEILEKLGLVIRNDQGQLKHSETAVCTLSTPLWGTHVFTVDDLLQRYEDTTPVGGTSLSYFVDGDSKTGWDTLTTTLIETWLDASGL